VEASASVIRRHNICPKCVERDAPSKSDGFGANDQRAGVIDLQRVDNEVAKR
jgi:hypothetical protein